MGKEQALQSRIIKDLKAKGWITVKTIKLSENGFPDIFAFRNKVSIFIEVKSPTGIKSELQKYRIEQLTKHGFLAFFCDSFEQYLSLTTAPRKTN